MIYSIFDLGTNVFSVLVASSENNDLKELHYSSIAVKLGEGGINKSEIAKEAFERGVKAMEKLREETNKFKISKHFAFATSAIRSASNGNTFREEVLRKTGVEINVIDGNREAELIYKGVINSTTLSEKALIMDIGGGSTEFIIGDSQKIYWKKSYQLGVARMLGEIKPSNPLKQEEIKQLRSIINEEIIDLVNQVKKYNLSTLLGVSGPFSSYLSMIAGEKHNAFETSKCVNININDIKRVHSNLVSSSHTDRLRMDGLLYHKADMMVLASVFIELIINRLNIKRVDVSAYSLKQGAFFELLENEIK